MWRVMNQHYPRSAVRLLFLTEGFRKFLKPRVRGTSLFSVKDSGTSRKQVPKLTPPRQSDRRFGRVKRTLRAWNRRTGAQ